MIEIVLGPPGTGKTTTLLEMVDQELARGTEPDRIAYVSFTRRAAMEATDRACEKFRLNPSEFPYFRTLHSLCFRHLGLSNSDVFEGRKLQEFGYWIGQKVSAFKSMDETSLFGFTRADRALFMENLARVTQVELRELFDRDCDDLSWSFVNHMSKGLAKYKEANDLLDYTDMLDVFVQSGGHPKIDVLFVDESQDLSMIQWKVVTKLGDDARRVVVAGDDDQAIYRWAGAAVDHFVDMEGDVKVLDQSWRVPKSVQKISADVISRVSHRREKVWKPRDEEGEVNWVSTLDDLNFDDDESVLFLSRNVFSLRDHEHWFRSLGVLYELRGNLSVRKSVLSAVINWEKLRRGEEIPIGDVIRVYEHMSVGDKVRRGFKKLPGEDPDNLVSLAWLREHGGLLTDEIWHVAMNRLDRDEVAYMLSILKSGNKLTTTPKFTLSTIHGSKGGQADHVVLVTDMARKTHEDYLNSPEDEARVWYVACTRTRQRLSILRPSDKYSYDL